ncbi:alpha,alpha-trehalose-phosphate synthase (UDP-forming) [Bradyrhizobium sp.]|uniref:alpha,alpha-trehalose-phosphate synthase (UDP-forming) n=1 Tax=Bradyrhizobium sp. TaxID=376 RepID=UPI0040378106
MPIRFSDFIKYGIVALAVTTVLALLLAPYAGRIVEQWARADVEARSRLVFHAVEPLIDRAAEEQTWSGLSALFSRVALDKRILAAGYCDASGVLIAASPEMPAGFSCEKIARAEAESFSSIRVEARRILVAAFPMVAKTGRSYFVILTDLSFVDARSAQVLAFLLSALAGATLVLIAVGGLFAVLMLRSWMNSLKRAVEEIRQGETPRSAVVAPAIDRELRRLLRESELVSVSGQIEWNPKSLLDLLNAALPGAEVLVVSNREPYIHNRSGEGVVVQSPASGLVSALEPVMRACGGTWIAHGSGSADRETVDAADRVRVPEASPAYTLRRIWISEEEQDGYYYGFANEALWPLCHIVFVRPTLRKEDWEHYKRINRRFADAVIAESRTEDPVVLVQDYHLALVPGMIREKLPRATIATFWHIPWPNAETFGICPWKEEIIEGLLGSTIVGFHTQFHCNNFLECVDRFLESRIDREIQAVSLGGHQALIRPYPISIEWPPRALERVPDGRRCRAEVLGRFGLPQDIKLVVGIERFDYTKGIIDRMRAVEALLDRAPAWKDRLVFIQVAAPTRSKLDSYARLQAEAEELARDINARQKCRHGPIVLVVSHYEQEEVFKLFRAADACIVSSLHDGMNLVAKEFVAARADQSGVLVLSSFTGASREMPEAIIVNPYDTEGLASAIERALTMPRDEQIERMKLMRTQIKENNVYRWAAGILIDAARCRKRDRLVDFSSGRKGARPASAGPGAIPLAMRRATAKR